MFPVNLNGDDEFSDHDVVLIETTGAGQAPEWDGEESMIAALESQFLDLRYLMDDMLQEGGMNQQLAMEAHRILPEMVEKYPLGYFTKTTTGTLYKPALEELHAGVWALIGAASLAVAAMIWKFVRWIIRKWKGEDPGSSDGGRPSDAEIASGIKEAVQVAEEKIHTQEKVASELTELKPVVEEVAAELTKEVAKVRNSAKSKTHAPADKEDLTSEDLGSFESAADALLDRHDKSGRLKVLRELSNNAWFDILHDGRWTKTMTELAPVLSSVEAQLVQRLQVFESIFSVTQTQGDPVRHKNAMQLINQVKDPIKLPSTEYHSLQALSQALSKPEGMMSFNAGKEKFNPVHSVEKIGDLMRSTSYRSLLQARVKFIEKLTMLNAVQTKLGEISNKWNASHPGQGVGVGVPEDISHAIGPAMTALKRDLVYMMLVNTAVEQFLDETDRLNMAIATWWSTVFTLFGHYAANQPAKEGEEKIEMPAQVQKAQGILSFLRQSMGKVPAGELGKKLAGAASSGAGKLAGHARQAIATASSHAGAIAKNAVNAGAAKPAGAVDHPAGSVAPGVGARQIPKAQWQKP